MTTVFDLTMSRVDTPVPAESLLSVLVKLGRAVEHRLQGAVGDSDVNATQLLALIDIAREPGISRAGLARRLRVTPQAVTGIVSRLRELGLINREITGPGRATELTVAPRGMELLRRHGAALRSLHCELLGTLDPPAVWTFDTQARRLLDHWDTT